MFKVGRALMLAAGSIALALLLTATMLAPRALAQTTNPVGSTLGSDNSVGSSIGAENSPGSSIGSENSVGGSIGLENSVGSSIGTDLGGGRTSMGVATGALQPDAVGGQGAPSTTIIGGGDASNYSRRAPRRNDADDGAGDDWVQVK